MAGMLSSRRTERALTALGYMHMGTSGSHKKFTAPNGIIVVLPLGHTEVLERYVRRACALGGINWDAFRERY
jgi:predicted RNA binding protein YcfA (HicA-like mRNA interferase family)